MLRILKDIFKVRKPALLYLRKYGVRATFYKAKFILSKGGLRYFDSSPSSKPFSSLELLNESQIIFVSNDLASVSNEYRIKNLSRAYWELSIPNIIIDIHELKLINVIPRKVQLFYFWRTNLDLESIAWYRDAKFAGVKFAYDSDDLTFDERFYNELNVSGLKYIPKEEAMHLVKTVCPEQANQVKQSDFAIAGTYQLQESFRFLGAKTIFIPNFAPRWMENQAAKLRLSRMKNESDQYLKIVYASGSRTHQQDFQAAKDALFEFLGQNRDVTFTVIGASPFEDSDIPVPIRSQVMSVPMVRHEDLMSELMNYDVHIAPLETKNPYVEAKSSLKFIHAALLCAPIVATPTGPFKSMISNGVNGYLASSKQEWILAFEKLKVGIHRKNIGHAALTCVLQESLTESAFKPLMRMLEIESAVRQDPINLGNSMKQKKVVWVLPSLMIGSGGHRNVFRLANRVRSENILNSVCFSADSREPDELGELIDEHYLKSEFRVERFANAIFDADVIVGTHFSTLAQIKEKAGKNQKIAYLVQDFEPWFYPMSESYLEALQTYFDEKNNIITSGPWMADKIYEVTGRRVPHFQLPINKEIYKAGKNYVREGVLFFAKDDTPRRLYDFGLRCLEIVHSLDPNINIYFYGSMTKKSANFPFIDLRQLPALEDLSELYSKMQVGLAFSPTNPSLVPYEMMACGLPIVDIDLPGEPMRKFGFLSEAITCDFNEFKVASRILKLLSDKEVWKQISEEGVALTDQMPDEDEAAKVVSHFISELLRN
jgi:glycosyltransferase involved in cell wall biosynthesis